MIDEEDAEVDEDTSWDMGIDRDSEADRDGSWGIGDAAGRGTTGIVDDGDESMGWGLLCASNEESSYFAKSKK